MEDWTASWSAVPLAYEPPGWTWRIVPRLSSTKLTLVKGRARARTCHHRSSVRRSGSTATGNVKP